MKTPPVDNELATIRQELNELREVVGAMRGNGNGHYNGNGSSVLEAAESTALTDRRGMMKKMAGLAVGVAAVGLLRPTRSMAGKTSSDAPDTTFNLGVNNSVQATTELQNFTTALLPIQLKIQNFGAIGGAFNAPANTSIAVVGHANTLGGSPINNAVVGVYGSGISAGSGDATGVVGSGSDVGVHGTGLTSNAQGVLGIANSGTSAHGVEGTSTTGAGGAFTGARAALFLSAGSGAVADPNVTSPGGVSGDIYRGSTNTSLWYRASTGYRRLADSTTAGALTAFAASSRFVNLDPLGAGVTHAYQIGGVTVTGNTVPAKARAIIGRIADANPTGGGGGILVGATNPPVGGVIAVIAGAPENSYFFSALDATGKLYVKNTSPSGSVQVIIDIQGYYE